MTNTMEVAWQGRCPVDHSQSSQSALLLVVTYFKYVRIVGDKNSRALSECIRKMGGLEPPVSARRSSKHDCKQEVLGHIHPVWVWA